MRIQILNTEPFVMHNKTMGLVKHNFHSTTNEIIFMHPNGDTEVLFTSHVTKPDEDQIHDELLINDNLRTLASEAQYIYVQESVSDFLSYCKSYS